MANKIKVLNEKQRVSLAKKVEKVSMPIRWKKMFTLKYGLKDGVYRSYADVGRKFKVSGEAVRQIIVKVEALFIKS